MMTLMTPNSEAFSRKVRAMLAWSHRRRTFHKVFIFGYFLRGPLGLHLGEKGPQYGWCSLLNVSVREPGQSISCGFAARLLKHSQHQIASLDEQNSLYGYGSIRVRYVIVGCEMMHKIRQHRQMLLLS